MDTTPKMKLVLRVLSTSIKYRETRDHEISNYVTNISCSQHNRVPKRSDAFKSTYFGVKVHLVNINASEQVGSC